PGEVILKVRSLATSRLHHRLERFRPLPPRLKFRSPHHGASDLHEVHLALVEPPRLLRLRESLDFHLGQLHHTVRRRGSIKAISKHPSYQGSLPLSGMFPLFEHRHRLLLLGRHLLLARVHAHRDRPSISEGGRPADRTSHPSTCRPTASRPSRRLPARPSRACPRSLCRCVESSG